MKKTYYFASLDAIAKSNGYKDKYEMFGDYSFIPTVMTPRHKKIEIIPLLWRFFINKKR